MMQESKLLSSSPSILHKAYVVGDINTTISAELLWAYIIQTGFADIAWRKAITPPPAMSEVEHQKMAFLQKLIDVVRKSNASKPSPIGFLDENPQRSAKIAPNSSNQ